MEWPTVIALIFLTPMGWIGLLCVGVALAAIIGALRG